MTVSGTTTFDLDFVEAIEEAFERAGIESRTGYDMRTARRSINLLFADWANRGINLWTIEERSQTLTSGTAAYILGTDIVDLLEHMVEVPNQSQTTRYRLSRVSVATYAGRTNPTIAGRPTEIYIDRQRAAPEIHLWPVPDQSGYTLAYWVLRRMDDAGAYTNTSDMPFRFLPPFISGLAFMIAEKKRLDDPQLITRLGQRYDQDWRRAAEEDREKATLTITPRGASYRVGRQ